MTKSIEIRILLRIILSGSLIVILFCFCSEPQNIQTITVYPDSVLNDVSSHPIGINLDFFMDDDQYLMPAIKTVDAIKKLGIRYLRYPGGNKSDLYHFSSPPWEKAAPRLSRTGTSEIGYARVLKNSSQFKYDVLDFDEFMKICKETGCEPVVVVAADEYLIKYPPGTMVSSREDLIWNASEWVRYANIKKKYNVKYWMIGNECWNENNVNSNATIYANDVVEFSRAMKRIDPSISIIPNGNSLEFCDTVLKIAGNDIDFLCVSNYPVYRYQAGYATFRDTLQDLMSPVARALKAIENQGLSERLKVIVAEYGPFDWAGSWPMTNDLGHTMCNFEIEGEQLLNDRIEFSCFWNTRWIDNDSLENQVWDALDKNGNMNATGLGIMIWGNCLGKKMIATKSSSNVKTYASLDPNENLLWIYLLNKAETLSKVKINIEPFIENTLSFYGQLSGKGPSDTDPVWNTDIQLKPEKIKSLDLPGFSITVIGLKLKSVKANS
jgi:alpha-L-arabinofuranosidase